MLAEETLGFMTGGERKVYATYHQLHAPSAISSKKLHLWKYMQL